MAARDLPLHAVLAGTYSAKVYNIILFHLVVSAAAEGFEECFQCKPRDHPLKYYQQGAMCMNIDNLSVLTGFAPLTRVASGLRCIDYRGH